MKSNLKIKIKVWNEYHNPIYYWWKARKYFKFPRVVFHFSKYCDYAYRPREPFIGIKFYNLMWKDKYNNPRHERDPRISIYLFRKLYLYIIFTYETKHRDRNAGTYAVWEAMLDFLFYNKTIGQCYYNNQWSAGTGKDAKTLDIKFALTKKALKLI